MGPFLYNAGMRFLLLIAGLTTAFLQAGAAQVRQIDAERLLSSRFGFAAVEVDQVRSGQAVAKLLNADDATEIGAYGAVRIDAKAEQLVYWLKDIANFRKAAELGAARRLSDPPTLADFDGLALEANDLDALRACRPGKCDLRLGDKAIERFQTGVDWSAADASARANLLARQLLLDHALAYLKGGDRALGAAHNEKAPKVAADEFHQVLWKSKGLYDIAPRFATYLEDFPTARLADSETFLYWAKSDLASDPSVTLHQMVIYHAPSGDVFIADKLLYASRYVDAALLVISLGSSPNGSGFYALVGARASSTMLKGIGARLLRGTVETATRDTVTMYLNWIRASLTSG